VSALSADTVSVRYGRRIVVDGVSVALQPGQVTAIVGPNGAGKSSLLSALAGLHRPASGVVRLGGADLFAMGARERARRIGFMAQSQDVAWAIDVRTLVGLGRTPYLGARGLAVEDEAAVEKAMAAAEVQGFADRLVTQLSGGERARVLIARALAGKPEWLLADEPLAGLDPGHQIDAADLFNDLATAGQGVVVTLHDLTLAARMAGRIVVLADGQVISDGPPASALAPEVLARAYGIDARFTAGAGGPLIEVVGRHGRGTGG
jgi:iron complex transport system ATP-binding protein